MSILAIPAKRGIWKTLKLQDGTEVRAMLCGDEHVHYWMTDDGQRYVKQAGEVFSPITTAEISKRAMARRASLKNMSQRLRSPRKVEIGNRTHYEGMKKGLVIMAQFTDVKFQSANNLAKYKRILNEEGYSEGSFRGSVSDYFKAQSDNKFELNFDVVGPYTMSREHSYYGENDENGNDKHAEEMIKEACEQADSEVNFADYDWDGDGEVDQVFVVYAGKGEADGGASNTIWPHMYDLENGLGAKLTLDGTKVNTYACSNEVDINNNIEGIGCFCHEFSHCMGFPDFYDTSYSGWFGMGDFDLMCGGSYNGNTFCPAGYTAHEKMMCGWQEPIVLSKDTVVTNMKSMAEHGETFIIYNDAYPDEYYMLENRQKTGWDAFYPAKGLMITHVDFDKNIWCWNCPNTKITSNSEEHTKYGYPVNDHQRLTIVHADNDDDSKYWVSSEGYYTKDTESTDLYPYGNLDSLTSTSKPAATFYNKNSKGSMTADWAILNIKQNADGTMGFTYLATNPYTPVNNDAEYEKVTATSQLVSGSKYILVNEDDEAANGSFDSKYLSAVDVTINGNTVSGDELAPITLGGDASGYSLQIDGKYIYTVAARALKLGDEEKKEWLIESTSNGYVVKSKTSTYGTIQYNSGTPRFMNYTSTQSPAVLYVKKAATAIKSINTNKQATTRIYTIDGRYVGTDPNQLPRGLYVVNGKKIVK